GKGLPGEPQRAGEDHRQAGDRVERLADPREERVVLLAPVDAGGGSSPEAHRIHRHGSEVYRSPPCAARGSALLRSGRGSASGSGGPSAAHHVMLLLEPPRFATVVRSLAARSEEHTSELQSLRHLVCRLLLEKKNWLWRRRRAR